MNGPYFLSLTRTCTWGTVRMSLTTGTVPFETVLPHRQSEQRVSLTLWGVFRVDV